jgi:hypothetical protein
MNRLDFARVHYQGVRDRLRTEDPDLDEQTLADTVEGLTDLHDIIAAIMRSALTDEALAEGLKARLADMEERRNRLLDRASKRRTVARDVMVDAQITKITAADFTLSVRPGTPALVVVNEAEIPLAYWEPREPRLNRQALLGELKRGDVVGGVALSNPEPVLSVRVK